MGQSRNRHIRIYVLLFFGFILPLTVHTRTARSENLARKPSLDRLTQRVADYWTFLQRGKKMEALKFATEDTRDALLARREPAFSEPRLVRLEPAAGGQVVAVTVEVKRLLPPLRDFVQFPVTEEWVFQKGEWFVRVRVSVFPLASSERNGKESEREPGELERQREAILERLRFDKTEIDFGSLRKGRSASAEIEYQLSGEDPLGIKLADTPPGLVVGGLAKGQLLPGGPHKISFEFLSENYAGVVQENFSAFVRHGSASVTYEFTIRANVYAPVLAVPPTLRFDVNETEKEILIRNSSGSEVQIVALTSENPRFQVSPLPMTIAAGKEARLRARLLTKAPKNHREILNLRFAVPVEDMNSLELPVLVNPVDRPTGAPPRLSPEQIQKLIPKNRPPE